MNGSENSTISIWVGGTQSSEQYFRTVYSVTGARDAFTMYYTAAITLDGGIVNGTSVNYKAISFIDNCDSAKKSCGISIEYPCVRQTQCGQYYDTSTESQQDVKVFIAWTGTDSTGTPLRSYGLLPSNFRFLAFENYFNSFVDLLTPKS